MREFAITGRVRSAHGPVELLRLWRQGRIRCDTCGGAIAPRSRLARVGGFCFHPAHAPETRHETRSRRTLDLQRRLDAMQDQLADEQV